MPEKSDLRPTPPMDEPVSTPGAALPWPALVRGTLVKRYKRFLADVVLDAGETVTAHCPNSGSMKTCGDPGRPVWLSRHDSPRRKLPYTWELIEMTDSLVGINTLVPNRLTAAAVAAGAVPELAGYPEIRREVPVGAGSRIDMVLTDAEGRRCYVEVKNCTLVAGDGVARFPDAVTARGLKHLTELEKRVLDGDRCVMFYLVQRMDADRFAPADAIDPAYGEALRRAAAKGVEILAYDVRIDLRAISLHRRLPVLLDDASLP